MPRESAARITRDVGRRVAELRREHSWTQETFAEKLAVSLKYLQRIEAGRENLTLESLVRVARYLHTPVAKLFEKPTSRTVRLGRPRSREA